MRSMLLCRIVLLCALPLGAQAPAPNDPPPRAPTAAAPAAPPTLRVGTMSELMVHMIYPTSDAVFYITSRTPYTDAEWTTLQAQDADARRIGQPVDDARPHATGRWNKDSRLMLDAAAAAFKARESQGRGGDGGGQRPAPRVVHVCHKDYRPDYGKPRPPIAARCGVPEFRGSEVLVRKFGSEF